MIDKDLQGYLEEARWVVARWGRKHWLKDEDAMSFVAYQLMRADWKFDPSFGVKKITYRLSCARLCLGTLKKKDSEAKDLSLNIDNGEDGRQFHESVEYKREHRNIDMELIKKLVYHPALSDIMQFDLRKKFVEDYNGAEIAEMRGVSKQAVSDSIGKAINILKRKARSLCND